LANIRSKDTANAIMVITEALFPLDSSSPNLSSIQKLAKKHNAFLVIGCAHDFGILGDNGKGVW
jgi:7-keto-8-aminopelargonate synthetase-like enzyme